MIFSGHNFISLPEVDTLSFNVPISLNSIYGSGSFGFSGSGSNGESQIIKFEFISGEVRDFNGNYIYSYFPNREIVVSGDVFSRGHHYYINQDPVSLSGTQEYFRFKRFFYETSSEVSMESEASISIKKPSITFSSPMYIDISGTYTGSFEKSVEHKVYSLELDGLNHQMFDISSTDLNPGNKTGSYVFEPSANTTLYATKNYELTLLLETDFGEVDEQIKFTGYNPSDGQVITKNLTTIANPINTYRSYPKTKRSNTYSLLYSVMESGLEQDKPIGVELSYYDGGTGHRSGYKGDINIIDSGSGFFTGDAWLYVTGAGGSGFIGNILSEWTYPSPGPERGTGNINGIEVSMFGQDYKGPEEMLAFISGNQGSGNAQIKPIPYEYNKPFFETWDLNTGITQSDIYSFSGNSLSGAPLTDTSVYSDSNFSGGHELLPSTTTSLYIQVDFEPLYDSDPVIAKLEVTGQGFSLVEYITGIK